MNNIDNITWDKLVDAEPRLDLLLHEIEQIEDDRENPSFCANLIWYREYKHQFVKLVGKYAEGNDPILYSHIAYELAYKKLYDSLPDCRNCGCL